MQTTEQDSPFQKRQPKKGCLVLLAWILLICFTLAGTALASLMILDGPYTLSQRKERYKVACQFIWADFKGWIKRISDEPPPENDQF